MITFDHPRHNHNYYDCEEDDDADVNAVFWWIVTLHILVVVKIMKITWRRLRLRMITMTLAVDDYCDDDDL